MKKTVLALALFTMTGYSTFAQKAYEGKIKYKKSDEPALVIDYDYPQEVVQNALKAKLADLRLRTGTSKGFITANNGVISSITGSKLDYLFKTTESGKKDKKKTTLYMVMQGGNNISGDAVILARNGKNFLENLAPNVKQSNTIFEIKRQEDVLVTEEKKLKTLESEYDGLEKKMKANKEAQKKQEKIVTSQKSIISDLKGK